MARATSTTGRDHGPHERFDPLDALPSLWFGSAPVSRKAYVWSASGLAAFKIAVEQGSSWLVGGHFLPLLFYVSPLLSGRREALDPAPEWLAWTFAAWTVPFLWIAVSMSVRRALNAGTSGWWGFAILLPVLNLMAALVLMIAPAGTSEPAAEPRRNDDPVERGGLGVAITASMLGVVLGLGIVAFSTLILKSYGGALFVLSPVVLGAVTAYVYNARGRRSVLSTLGVVTFSTFAAAFGLLLFGIEGAVCLIIAAPVVVVPAWIGAVVGRTLACAHHAPTRQRLHLSLVILALPLVAAAETLRGDPPRYQVTTRIEIDAPPEIVWEHVIGFSELPEPDALLFRLGVAHPRRATIEGRGVGAVRRCEFSTGPFVEPITVWDPPHLLAFDVTSQPPPMHEWSPYKDLHPAHLDGTIRSKGGEFRLTALANGRTRIEGSTWYELDIFPQVYFRAWADALIHRIHAQVLEHVKRLSEAERPRRK